MKKFISDFIKRISSRKFLLALSACLVFYANKQWTELATAVVGYLAAEGFADTAERYQAQKTKATQNVLKATELELGMFPDAGTDRGDITPGNPEVAQ